MKVVLVGHPGSQPIIKASLYLAQKYLPGFDLIFLNHIGEVSKWASFVAEYLKTLDDELIILTLDDYLLAGPLNTEKFEEAIGYFMNPEIVNVKMCPTSEEEHRDYPVTTQYTIWRREFLIWLLEQVGTPWEFEMTGSNIFRQTRKLAVSEPMIEYPTHSSLSSRWQGVRTDGVKPEDLEELKKLGYL